MPRKYELKQRAKKQEETRQRIVEALVELHEEVGPANTTIKSVAQRAGVQRLTVYRHFPDELSMFQACSAHFHAETPAPDPSEWMTISDPVERLRKGLWDLYAYYEQSEQMLGNILRDVPQMPALAQAAQPFQEALRSYTEILSDGWEVPESRRNLLQAAIGHAIWFETWRSLVRGQQLETDEAIQLMVSMVTCTAHDPAARA